MNVSLYYLYCSFIFHDPRDFRRAAGAVRRVFLDNTNQCNNFTKAFYPCGMLVSVPVPIEQVCDDFKDGGCGKFDKAKVRNNYSLNSNVFKTRKGLKFRKKHSCGLIFSKMCYTPLFIIKYT